MRLSVRHLTRYAYDPPPRAALRLAFSAALCLPGRDRVARGREWRSGCLHFVNGLGEGEAIWTSLAPQSAIEIVAEGVVEASDSSGIVRGLADATRPAMFLQPTALTEADDAIVALAKKAKSRIRSPRCTGSPMQCAMRSITRPPPPITPPPPPKRSPKAPGVARITRIFSLPARAPSACRLVTSPATSRPVLTAITKPMHGRKPMSLIWAG